MDPHKPTVARDIMVTKLVTLTPQTHVHEAINLLLKHRFSGAPVVDEDKRIVGIFSEKDCMRVLIEGAFPTRTVAEFMSTEVRTITEETDLLSIAQIFRTTSYRRLPVVHEEKLVGQVSRRDLLGGVSKLLKTAPEKSSAFLYLSRVNDRSNVPFSP